MNVLENEIPPQVLIDSDFLSLIQAAKEQQVFTFPNALTAPQEARAHQRPTFVGFLQNYPRLQQFEPFIHEHPVTKISVRIAEAVETSRRILDLPDNWDEEGSPAYAEETWKRATQFIVRSAIGYRRTNGVWVGPPKITPGPDGSIDVRWKTSKRSALINFPAFERDPIQFFGSDGDTETIRGTLDLSSPNQWILMWLMR
jgi:hypothetical protein